MPTVYCAGFLFDMSADKVLLIRKNRPPWQRGRLNGIGGHVESGETPLKAMIREFQEEAGVIVSGWKERIVLAHVDWTVHFFHAERPPLVVPVQTTDEALEWCPIDRPPRSVLQNLRWLIPMMLDSLEFPIIVRDCGIYE